jgi:uncharacterized protein GlcG (DUF336 family)
VRQGAAGEPVEGRADRRHADAVPGELTGSRCGAEPLGHPVVIVGSVAAGTRALRRTAGVHLGRLVETRRAHRLGLPATVSGRGEWFAGAATTNVGEQRSSTLEPYAGSVRRSTTIRGVAVAILSGVATVITARLCAPILEAACARAAALGVQVSVAVVDDGGNLKAFIRMDGAEIAGPSLAVDKAYTAVANRIETHELARQAAPGGPLFGLHANAGGRFVIFGGGVPVVVGGIVVGGIGVSGAAVEQDVDCATTARRTAEELLR